MDAWTESMREAAPELKAACDRMREASGEVDDERRLVSFLYVAIRDGLLSPGAIEQTIMRNTSETKTKTLYTNGWLASYCQDVADRLS